jgi:antitoxin ParD1/3/4
MTTTIRKTITLTTQQNDWIKGQIGAEGFTNDSEYIRDLIRQEQARKASVEAIRKALIEGEQSGVPAVFDFEVFKQRKLAEHG